MKAIKIPVTGPLETVDWEDIHDVARLIEADYGYVERVKVGEAAALAVHESGRLIGLPENKRAGVLYGTHIHGQPIVGPVLYMHEAYVEAGEDSGIDFTTVENPEATTEMLYGLFIVHGVEGDDHHEGHSRA